MCLSTTQRDTIFGRGLQSAEIYRSWTHLVGWTRLVVEMRMVNIYSNLNSRVPESTLPATAVLSLIIGRTCVDNQLYDQQCTTS